MLVPGGGERDDMDRKLMRWARAVKARRGRSGRRRLGAELPPLWLFTDADRLPDPRPVVAALPRGLCGVVLRHDADPARAALGRALARSCRARRAVLVVAGDVRLARALGAGLHLRAGRRSLVAPHPGRIVTSSAHGMAELRRAARAEADAAFLSPLCATASHPGGRALGLLRWAALARRARLPVCALGGVTGRTVAALPAGAAAGAGAIGALRRP
jgi:thiamine-phosphate pyrophosphorylase